MKILLTGGTGFIGTALVRRLASRGDECVVVSRSGRSRWPDLPVRMVRADPTQPGEWQAEIFRCDGVVNLAGERIVEVPRRWTRARKQVLWTSRVSTTGHVVEAIRRAVVRPRVLVSGSAIGYYGDRGGTVIDERLEPGRDFAARLCVAWESAARAAARDTRVVLIRSGLVLGLQGGPLPLLLRPFRLGLGGPWGDGRQWWPWIHLEDEVGLILFALDHDLSGPVNLTAPAPVTVTDFARELGRVLHRPARIRVPGPLLRLGLGEAAEPLLKSYRVVPRRAEEAGYQFRFPEITAALQDLLPGG